MDNPVNFSIAGNGQENNKSFQSSQPSSLVATKPSSAVLEGSSMLLGDDTNKSNTMKNKSKKDKSKKDKKTKSSKSKLSKSSLHLHYSARESDEMINVAGCITGGIDDFDDEVAHNAEDDAKLPVGVAASRSDLNLENQEGERWDELACPDLSTLRLSATASQSRAALPMHQGAAGLRSSMESHTYSDETMSVLTSDEFSSQIVQDMRSVNEHDVSHDLLVSYMVSMGADRATADQLAYRFAAEQSRSSIEHEERSFRFTRPPSMGTSKAVEVERFSNRYRSASDEGSNTVNTPALTQCSESSAPVAHAISVKASNSHLPIVYAESNPMDMKQLLNERPVRRMVFMTICVLISVVIGVVVYFTAFKPQATEVDIEAPSTSPSLAPTFISRDILAIASKLSGFPIRDDPTSPQLRAVSWMSSLDNVDYIANEAFAQRYALVVMYFSFNGEGWADQEHWLDSTLHECNWSKGIFCEYDATETLVVTGFDATKNNLQGNIPNEIGLLTSIQSFGISTNNVGGAIPSSIGSLPLLSALDLSSNTFEGTIPSTIGGAGNLVLLDLSGNNLNSTIPIEIYTLKFLRILKLQSNKLSGRLNERVNDLQALVNIDLSNNELTGTLPLTLDTIPTLETIWLDHNQFTGELPNITNSLALKQSISLSHNKLSGNAKLSPDFDFTKIDVNEFKLKYVDVSFNELSGPVAAVFFFLPTLRYFDISGNGFVGTFPSDVGWFGIEYLAAASNALTGTVPAGWPTLTHLDMSNNQFSSGVPEALCNFTNLQFLVLSDNSLGSTVPSCLGNIPTLRDLEISNSRLTGALPGFLRQLNSLEILDLSGNMLTGSLPAEIGDLMALQHLLLEDNKLTGSIPTNLSNLSGLRTLNLSDNLLTGAIPSEIGSFDGLESLLLSGNQLEGTLPEALCELTSLDLIAGNIGCDIVCNCCSEAGAC